MENTNGNVGIAGMGFYFPEEKVDTRSIKEEANLEDWIYENAGINTIYKPSDIDRNTHMAYNASVEALKDANMDASEIDLIVVCVFRNDYWHWQMSTWLKDKLKAVNADTLEVCGGCSAHFFSVETAVDQIRGSDDINNVLVVCSERFFGYGWPTFLSSGGQAIVLKRNCPQYRYLGFYTSNLIRYHENAYIKYGGTAFPFNEETVWNGVGFQQNVEVNEDIYFEHIKPGFFDKFKEITDKIMENTGHNISEVDYVVSIIQQKKFDKKILESIGLPHIPCGLEYKAELGHFSGADTYIVLDKARKDGKIKKGDLILSFTIGGIAWCVELIEY